MLGGGHVYAGRRRILYGAKGPSPYNTRTMATTEQRLQLDKHPAPKKSLFPLTQNL